MRKFLSLLKISLNLNFGISALKYRFTKEKKRIWEPIAIGISILFGVGTLVGLYSFFLFALFLAGSSLGQPEMILTVAIVSAQIMVLIFGILYLMSSFYFSSDMSILIPLPLKPFHVLGSKFAVIMVNEYLVLFPMLLPALLIYGIGTGQNLFYWIKSILVLLFTPAIPLAIGALFIVILMRFINVRKSKDLLAVIGSFIGILFGVGVNFFMQQIPEGSEKEFFQNILTQNSGLIEQIGNKFPPGIWGTYSLSLPGWRGLGYLGLFIGVSALLLAALLWIGNHFFYRSITAGQEVSRKQKAVSKDEMERQTERVRYPIFALFFREWKLFIRTPIYAMNGLAGMIMLPFLMLMPFFTKNKEVIQLFVIMENPEYHLHVSLGCLAFMLFVSSMNIVACTSVSREGDTFWYSKMIPVSPFTQVLAKLLHSLSLSAIGLTITAVIFVALFKLSILLVLVIWLLGLLGSVLINIVNLSIDVLRPKLDWTNPQEAVKSNINGFFGILVTLLVIAVLGLVSVPLVMAKLPSWLVFLLLGMVIIVLIIPFMYGLYVIAERQYRSLES